MPYISKAERYAARVAPVTAGQLNFAVTEVIQGYAIAMGLSYQTINDVVGVLEGVKAEFQRRVVGPYEDRKREENGEVYSPLLLDA